MEGMLHRPRTQEEKDRDNAARRRRRARMTRAEKDRYNKLRRAYRLKKYRADPQWRAKVLTRKQKWTARKRARCPQYVTLERARSKQERLRNAIVHHQEIIDRFDRELVRVTFEIEKLRKECRGK